MRLAALAGLVLGLPVLCHAGDPVRIETDDGVFEIDRQSLAIRAGTGPDSLAPVVAPAFVDGDATPIESASGYEWIIDVDDNRYNVTASAAGGLLDVAIVAESPGTLAWPQSTGRVDAYALPVFGEGKYVPAGDARWVRFLTQRAERHDAVGLSLPIATELRDGASLTWIFDPPFDTDLVLRADDNRLAAGLEHAFSELDPGAAYRVRFYIGPGDPVAGAKRYRELLQAEGRFVSLEDKARANPAVRKLGGAPHIYLWDRGPLKTGDVRDWFSLLDRFAERRDDPDTLSGRLAAAMPGDVLAEFDHSLTVTSQVHFVGAYSRKLFVRALNAALPNAVTVAPRSPLPGGHDPAAQHDWIAAVRQEMLAEYPGCFVSPERWGGGLSLDTIDRLRDSGIEHAWLGTESWLDILWHPEAAAAALEAGYLLGAYDSYGSAHPEDLADTWDTAQMGDAIYKAAAYRRKDGTRVTGFANRGVYVNPLAISDYAQARIAAYARAMGVDSYFLDVDATGENFADYTPGRRTSRREVETALRRRLAFASETLGLVTGSEGGVSLFAPEIHFAHGMTTVPFKWTNPAMKERGDDRYFVGGYWPPEAPDIFFKSTELPDEQRRLFFAPEFRLPLYQVALHDSVVTTHHWEYPTLRFVGERERTELIHMLYMVPPLYHLSSPTLSRDLPAVAAFTRAFASLHAELYDEAMTDFRFLSDDRLLQQTTFANGTTITVNFGDTPWECPDGNRVPPGGLSISTATP